LSRRPLRVAVIGAGWAGLAAAVRAVQRGSDVTLFEMAPRAGGRARAWAEPAAPGGGTAQATWVDNGQHILIGAYSRTLDLMRTVGVDLQRVFDRRPLCLQHADGSRLAWGTGAPTVAFLEALWTATQWSRRDRLAFLAWAVGWQLRRFRCGPQLTVRALARSLPDSVRLRLIEPLCVAALNTPADVASGTVFLRVLQDALAGGRGASDLLLPRQPLQALLPDPAVAWLRARRSPVHLGRRVQALQVSNGGVAVDGESFDAAVLATTSVEAARLAEPLAPAWAAQARSLAFESIVTVWLDAPGWRLPAPMLALDEGPAQPAQFLFDHGTLADAPGRLTAVISGANQWLEGGTAAIESAVAAQVGALGLGPPGSAPRPVRTIIERRATFRCTPGVHRPGVRVAPGLVAAADYVEGPYPATLEGAVRAGERAAALLPEPRSTGPAAPHTRF
jgi:squalene-associated FAD-dependent desaturase